MEKHIKSASQSVCSFTQSCHCMNHVGHEEAAGVQGPQWAQQVRAEPEGEQLGHGQVRGPDAEGVAEVDPYELPAGQVQEKVVQVPIPNPQNVPGHADHRQALRVIRSEREEGLGGRGHGRHVPPKEAVRHRRARARRGPRQHVPRAPLEHVVVPVGALLFQPQQFVDVFFGCGLAQITNWLVVTPACNILLVLTEFCVISHLFLNDPLQGLCLRNPLNHSNSCCHWYYTVCANVKL
mmetsp:Transcript_34683/g.60485  ORF Transcript_34683/g.60485 Transcript_34683/m.60485 type:complete len:237 (+) Transcript_34683:469-1179(+)